MKAHLTLSKDGLVAQLETGERIFAGYADVMAQKLCSAGVTSDELTVADWKTDPDHAPTSGQINTIKYSLRRNENKTMTVEDALVFADNSTVGATFYQGKWDAEAALALMADEIRKLREERMKS